MGRHALPGASLGTRASAVQLLAGEHEVGLPPARGTIRRAASAPRIGIANGGCDSSQAGATPTARWRARRRPAAGAAVDALCGHRTWRRTCTREHGHAAKSHRYS